MISKQTTATVFPSTLSQAERIRFFKSYTANGYVPATPVVTGTTIPTTQPVYPPGNPIMYYKPITMPATPYYMPTPRPMAFPTQAPTSGSDVSGQNTGISLTELNLQGK